MRHDRAKQYLENQILTAPREQLLLMLFDGAIRFAEQGRSKIDSKEYEAACKLLIRAQRIMIELITSLDRDKVGDELYRNLVNLYNFVYFRLVRGNVGKDVTLIDEGLKILLHLKETWTQAVEKSRREGQPEAILAAKSEKPPEPPPSISIEG